MRPERYACDNLPHLVRLRPTPKIREAKIHSVSGTRVKTWYNELHRSAAWLRGIAG